MNPVLVVSLLIVLHGVDGEEIFVNPEHVTTLHHTKEATKGTPNQLMTGGVNCVVALSNGKFVSVVEDCNTVRKKMEESK